MKYHLATPYNGLALVGCPYMVPNPVIKLLNSEVTIVVYLI